MTQRSTADNQATLNPPLSPAPIVVLGANAFSATYFIDYCLQRGHSVLGIGRSAQAKEPFLAPGLRPVGQHSNYRFQQLDINHDLDAILAHIASKEAVKVVNFAAQSMVAESWENPNHWYQTNVMATCALHEGLRKTDNLHRYVHISTPEVYGSCAGLVTEEQAYAPSTPYAVSRAAADMNLQAYFDAYKFPMLMTRGSNVYGPGQQLYRIIPRVILYLLKGKKIPLHGGGVSRRNFIHVEDLAAASYRVMEHGSVGEIYHISTDQLISIRDLVGLICHCMNKSFDESVEVVGDRLGKDAAYILANNKIGEQLDWQAEHRLTEGIQGVISWVEHYFNQLSACSEHYQHQP